jgi:hypothetical protein
LQPFHGVGYPPSFSLTPQAQIGHIPIIVKTSALLPHLGGVELNCSRCRHAHKRIARDCCSFVALEQRRDDQTNRFAVKRESKITKFSANPSIQIRVRGIINKPFWLWSPEPAVRRPSWPGPEKSSYRNAQNKSSASGRHALERRRIGAHR